jgi:hypothetical protein
MNKKLLLLISLIGLLSSFHVDKSVQVTFKNSSYETFKELHVWIMDKKFDFYNIKPGQSTDAITVSTIYNSCTVQVITLKGKIAFIPVDHVGETTQTNGIKSFSLIIISDSNGKRKLEFAD